VIEKDTPPTRGDVHLVDSRQLILRDPRTDLCFGLAKCDQVSQLRSPERPQRSNDVDRLEEVGLALAVVADEDVEPLAGLELERLEIAQRGGSQNLDPQLRSSSA
jgi:hypothetical protein